MLAICNGFQIACEAGLLPGALVRNGGQSYICDSIRVRVERAEPPSPMRTHRGAVLRMPIAHGEGRFVADPHCSNLSKTEGRVVFRYVDAAGAMSPSGNPNGSTHGIAGIINAAGNVLGLMPHPERVVDPVLGPPDGFPLFESLVAQVTA